MRAMCSIHRRFVRGCEPCKAYSRAYHKLRRRGLQDGTWERDWTGAELARVQEHVRALLAVPGITGPILARVTGISTHTIYSSAAASRTRITAVNGRALLAATPEVCLARNVSTGDTMVDSTGLARRLQALAVERWDARTLAAMTNSQPLEISRWRSGFNRTVRLRTHERFKALYEKIQGLPDPLGPSIDAQRQAQRLGYLPPERWADEDIDNPLAEPLPELPDTDDQVLISQQIQRALEFPTPGQAAGYPRAVQREIAKRARHDDWPWERIAELLGFKSANSAEYLVGGRPDRPPVKRERAK